MFDGGYSHTFHAMGALLVGVGWVIALAIAVYVLLRRAIGVRA
jgi:hypothetical protein